MLWCVADVVLWLALLAAQLPLEVVLTPEEATPSVTVAATLPLAVLAEGDARLAAPGLSVYWYRRTACALFVLFAGDADDYRDRVRPGLVKWVDEQDSKQLEWAVVVVEPANAWGIMR